MDRIASANKKRRLAIFNDVANKSMLSNYIIEKDFWVSWVLGKIFADEELNQILCFKGGTSISKAFHLIERFSEDIDLILSLKTVIHNGENIEQSSNTKQAAFNDIIEERAGEYISTILKDKINKVLAPICEVKVNEDDFHVLNIVFPRVFDYSYIKPEIKLEIGPLALWNPNDKFTLSSFVSKYLPELELSEPLVPTIKPERTFWEKITILHHEHYRPVNSKISSRYSRHYYDIYKMGHSDVKEKAFSNLELLNEVVSFKKRFYPRGWAKYEEAVPGTMRLIPADHSKEVLAEDYERMKNMIYGDAPEWNDIMTYISNLETEINNLPK